MKLGKKIKYIRLKENLTQDEFADLFRILASSLRKYELNVGYPKYQFLKNICTRFPQYTLSLMIDDISVKQIKIPRTLKKRIKHKKNRS